MKWKAVCKKQIHHYGILTLNCHFWTKCESVIHNNTSASEKVHPVVLSHQNPPTYFFRTVFTCKSFLICAYFSPDWDEMTFHLRKHYFGYRTHMKLKHLNDGFVSYKHTSFHLQDVNWWTGVAWIIVMFLSAVWTLILTAPIHCRGSIGELVMQWYIYPSLFQWRNSFTSLMAWGQVNFQQI